MKLADVSAAMDSILDAVDERIKALCEQCEQLGISITPDDPILNGDEDGEDGDGEDTDGTEGTEDAETDAEGGADGNADAGADAGAEAGTDGGDGDTATDDMGADGDDVEKTDECMQSVDEEVPAQSDDTGADGVVSEDIIDDPNQPPVDEASTDDIVSQLQQNLAPEDGGAVVANEDKNWDGVVRDKNGRETGLRLMDDDGRVNPDKVYKPGRGLDARSINVQQRIRQNKLINQDAARDAVAAGKILSECGDAVEEGCCGGKKGCKKVEEGADGKFVLKSAKGYFMAGGNPLEDDFYTDDKNSARTFKSEDDAKAFADNCGDGECPVVDFTIEKL